MVKTIYNFAISRDVFTGISPVAKIKILKME